EKKFVLAALALLAITMVLLPLSGCKNDTVPEPTRYTVKFKTDHGTAPADITVVSGTKLTAEQLKGLADTADYIFEGWYDGETKAEGGTYTVTKDVTLVAKWRDRGTVAPVTFTPAGGALDYEDTVTLSSQEGATIHYTINDGEEKTGDSPVTVSVTGDTTITARATKDGFKDSEETKATYTLKRYTVTFNANGGSTVASQTVESGQKATRPAADPTLEGSWFLGWYSDEGLAKKFDFNTPITTATTVYAKWSYKLHIKPTTLTNYTSPHAPSTGTWTYVEFGDWPQTIKDASVNVYETKSKEMGMFTYYLGDDGNHYVKEEENANGAGYKYSNGEQAGQGGTSTKWFKVEPIVWRVLTEDYKDPNGNSTGNALLLAEKILTGGIPYYVDTSSRRITEKEVSVTVYPNNWQYSTIRAWLNGRYEEKDSQLKTYTDKGFLQTAFTESAQTLIADTTVDNTAASTTDAGSNLPPATDYACANTKDKIFLLSEKEATTGAYLKEKGITDEDYGFDEYSGSGEGNTRIRVTTDYAKATGAYQDSTEGNGGWWWLRSPYYDLEHNARDIDHYGHAYSNGYVNLTYGGVVPALSISLGGN
ncbi:MAG: InlB B-repeat-containing protein, partial [Spirochaetaceae bacterium]|nr:InlB B-repeat-containing protein [Spirochaetaceae bacterium]